MQLGKFTVDCHVPAKRYVALDFETTDPNLTETGTDAYKRQAGGHVFMAGLYFPDGGKSEILPWDSETKSRLRTMLDEGWNWVTANGKYELNWMIAEGILERHHCKSNKFHDILVAAPLIDESQPPWHYHMDGQAEHYGLPQKPLDLLFAAAEEAGFKPKDKKGLMKLLEQLPWDVVATYNDHDIRTTWDIFLRQSKELKDQKLERVYELETLCLPVLAFMESQGIKVDVEAARNLYDEVYDVRVAGILGRLQAANNGDPVSLNPSKSLTQFLLDRGHALNETAASTPEHPRFCTDAAALDRCSIADPLVQEILSARRMAKIAKDFCKRAILDNVVDGRIYPNINQMVSRKEGSNDSRGGRFGRLSMSNPNPQQVPKKDTVEVDGIGGLGTAMRRLFIAEDGCQFMAADFSSQEPRWIIHWAETWKIPGAELIGAMYREDPTISSHDIVAEGLVAPGMEYKTKRALAKIINLGKGYEMGRRKLIWNLQKAGLDPKQADAILTSFDTNFPHVKGASRAAMNFADQHGYVRTYFGRKLRFNMYEPVDRSGPAMPYNEAYAAYVMRHKNRTPIKRSATYRAFNRIVQGSSADQTKAAMVALFYCYDIVPTLQVHDELTDARIDSMEKVAIYKDVMENVVELTVPSLTEVTLGPSWAEGEQVA